MGRYLADETDPRDVIFSNLSSGIGDAVKFKIQNRMAEQKRKQDQEDAISLLKAKMELENQDPYKLAISKMMAGGEMGAGEGKRPKVSYGPTGPTISFEETPEEKFRQQQIEQDIKPLAGETAIRYAGANQALQDIGNITNILGLKQEGGKWQSRPDAQKVIMGAKAAGFREPRIFGVPVTGGLLETGVGAFAGDEARKLDLNMQTLAENVLRARTGAAAPEPEIVREQQRSMMRMFNESPEVWAERLRQNEQLMGTTAKEIRPMREINPVLGQSGGTEGETIGKIIEVNGKKYRVIGGDPNDPDIEEVK